MKKPEAYTIVQNAAHCMKCQDFIVSKHRHDFVSCQCGAIFVDGGQEYLRRGGEMDHFADCSWSIPEDAYNDCAEAVEEAEETGRNKFGIANAVLRKLREHNLIIAAGEYQVITHSSHLDEIMVRDGNDSVNRYKKVVE